VSKNRVNKKTIYFIIAVVVFGILPLAWKRVNGHRPDSLTKPDISMQKKENRGSQNVTKLANINQKIYESAENILIDEVRNLKRDPFSITKEALASLSTNSSAEGATEDSGQETAQTKIEKKNPTEGMELKGVLIDGDKKYALINNTLYCENEDINGMKLAFIKEGEVGLYSDGITYILYIKE